MHTIHVLPFNSVHIRVEFASNLESKIGREGECSKLVSVRGCEERWRDICRKVNGTGDDGSLRTVREKRDRIEKSAVILSMV